MGRPTKIGLDYFPLDVILQDDVELLEAEHGLIGYAILIKVWQKIYSVGYYIEWNSDTKLLFARRINTELTILDSVINSCFKRNLLDENMFNSYGILTSSGIQKRYLTVCVQSKRKSISIISEYLLVNSELTNVITELTHVNTPFSAQSKVKESKVNIKDYKKELLSGINQEDYNEINPLHLQLAIKIQKTIRDNIISGGASVKNIDNTKGKSIDTIRLMLTEYNPEQIESVCRWLKTDNFWAKNILSIETFRKQFNKLIMAANKNNVNEQAPMKRNVKVEVY